MRVGALVTGLIFLIIAGAGFVIPVGDQGQSISETDNLCQYAIERLGSSIRPSTLEDCKIINYMKFGVESLGLIGIILLIGGLMLPGKQESNYGEIEEYEKDEERT